MKYLAFLLLLSGCGSTIDSQFNDTLFTIENEFLSRGVDLKINFSIVFGDTGGAYAVCKKNKFRRKIIVDRPYWERSKEASKLYVLAHEIGHCLLNRKHYSDEIVFNNKTIPKSIMDHAPEIASLHDDMARDYYFDELIFID